MAELEEQQGKKNVNDSTASSNLHMFGRSYSSVGSSSSDFLIRTKGQVKIQWGNKFIDLIKNGKLNVDNKFIYLTDEVGNKDGIYVLQGESPQVILVINGNKIDLKGDSGTTYVSFQSQQETTAEQKYTALKNIGLIYNNLEEITADKLQNGIVYVEQDQKLYIIYNGNIQEYQFEIPNPYTKQFVLQKSDSSIGSILIKGSGIENSLAFDSLYLYNSDNQSYISSSGILYILINDKESVSFEQDKITFYNKIIAQTLESISATNNYGFRLYMSNSESTLEIDNLIVRKTTNIDSTANKTNIYPQYWFTKSNIIESLTSTDTDSYTVQLAYTCNFSQSDIVYIYIKVSIDDQYQLLPIPFTISKIDYVSNTISVNVDSEELSEEILSSIKGIDIGSAIIGQVVFLIGSQINPIYLTRLSQSGVDFIKSSGYNSEKDQQSIITRIGDLKDLVSDNIYGIYSSNGYFRNAEYIPGQDLPYNDNSNKFASTKWVNNILPSGSIIMYNGTTSNIPDGWALCDGTNGTPNLINNFIKSSNVVGETGNINIDTSEQQIPYYSLIFIMKL